MEIPLELPTLFNVVWEQIAVLKACPTPGTVRLPSKILILVK